MASYNEENKQGVSEKTPVPGANQSRVADNGTDLDAVTNLENTGGTDLDAPTSLDQQAVSAMASARGSAGKKEEKNNSNTGLAAVSSAGTDLEAATLMNASDTDQKKTEEKPAPVGNGQKSEEKDDPLVNRELGPVRLEKKLGQGGMGMVYLGTHLTLEKKVAVKILPGYLADRSQEYVERFRREAVAAGKLEHQNIVQVYDVNKSGEYYYIVMQYVEGTDIKEMVKKQGKLELKQALALTLQVARGLQAANSARVVHRDIKPENVMVNREGVAKIADFGLAGLADSELTREGQAMGSPYYMSPEQCSGSELDIRTDIYALGVTLYYMISGKHPYTGETPLEIMQKHSSAEIPKVSSLDSSIPEGVTLLIRRMMMKNRESRYKDPEELIADLEALLQDPDQVPVGAMKARPPLVSPVAAGIIAAAVLIALAIIFLPGRGIDNAAVQGNMVMVPTVTIGGIALPVDPQQGLISDGWTSSMRIAMLNMQARTENPFMAVQKNQLINDLRKSGIVVVEREKFDAILMELAVARTDLVDQNKAVKIGQLLNAHLMLNADLATAGPEGAISLNMVEVGTSNIFGSISEFFEPESNGRIPAAIMNKIVEAVDRQLQAEDITGRVAGVSGKTVALNIGLLHGVEPGQIYSILDDNDKAVGTVTINQVEDLSSEGLAEAGGPVIKGIRVRLRR